MSRAADFQDLHEIEEKLEERGELRADELRDGWGLEGEAAESLLDLLAGRPGVRRGRGRGRDRVRLVTRTRALEPDEPDDAPVLLPSRWQTESVERLIELLRYEELEGLLDSLLFTLRRARKQETGEDRRGSKRELATALVLRHGVDLLASPKVRKTVARATKVAAPGRWHPGKAAAIQFTRDTGFPPELAGRPLPSSPPSLEFLEPRLDLKDLQRFQKEVVRKILISLYEPGGRGLVSLPTGAGKTRVAVETLVTWFLERWDQLRGEADRGVVVWLAHTEELCEQAIACFQDVWRYKEKVAPVTLARCWGSFTKGTEDVEELGNALSGAVVLVSTPNRIASLIERDSPLVEAIGRQAGLVVIDEAHRAAAPTYRRLLEFFDRREPPVSVLGLTATPFRMEYHEGDPTAGTQELRELFGRLIEPIETLGTNARERLQEMEILARATVETLETSTAIRLTDEADGPLSQGDIERIDKLLALRTDRTPRRLEIFERLVPLADDPSSQILYFGPSVQDAECMAFLLQRRGIPAAVVSGCSKQSARRQAIEQFKEGKVRVLCNCEVLTTGFDAPKVTHVVMGRPTVSQVLYEQMVGRGLRGAKFGGTSHCTIIDCVDDYRGNRPQLGYEAFREVWCRQDGCDVLEG